MYGSYDLMEVRLWMVFLLHSIFASVTGPSYILVVLVPVAYNASISNLSSPSTSIILNISAIMLEKANTIISLVIMTSVK